MFLLINGREEYKYFDFFTGDCHPSCPQEWLAYRGSCYSFSKEEKDWNSSRASCRAQGAHLLCCHFSNILVLKERKDLRL
uniref:Uncharacterized protein n=1 Tax=Cyanoderma ruficeps TaxID=181631 RepID=A0A8C3RAT0_9PASS